MFDDDIVRDILRRVVTAASQENGFSDLMAQQIERQVRADWGGERPYIQHDAETKRIERDNKMREVWESGNHDIRSIATRFGVSTRQARRIIFGE